MWKEERRLDFIRKMERIDEGEDWKNLEETVKEA